ncbi:MAG: thioredoxin family protein [Bacteroidia bacterium]
MAGLFSTAMLLQSFLMDTESINFRKTTWNEIGRNARTEKKMIFVIVKAEWCPACKKMQRVTNDGKVGKFYNQQFVNTTFDADNLMQYYRASNWGITTVPALIFLDERRNVIHKVEGLRTPAGMIEEAAIALEKRKTIWARKKKNKHNVADSSSITN